MMIYISTLSLHFLCLIFLFLTLHPYILFFFIFSLFLFGVLHLDSFSSIFLTLFLRLSSIFISFLLTLNLYPHLLITFINLLIFFFLLTTILLHLVFLSLWTYRIILFFAHAFVSLSFSYFLFNPYVSNFLIFFS